MKKIVVKMFVKTWTSEKVQCEVIDENVIREFDIEPLFDGMKLFKGKNVWIEIVTIHSATTYSNFESKKNRLIQLYNYLIRRKFNQPAAKNK